MTTSRHTAGLCTSCICRATSSALPILLHRQGRGLLRFHSIAFQVGGFVQEVVFQLLSYLPPLVLVQVQPAGQGGEICAEIHTDGLTYID